MRYLNAISLAMFVAIVVACALVLPLNGWERAILAALTAAVAILRILIEREDERARAEARGTWLRYEERV